MGYRAVFVAFGLLALPAGVLCWLTAVAAASAEVAQSPQGGGGKHHLLVDESAEPAGSGGGDGAGGDGGGYSAAAGDVEMVGGEICFFWSLFEVDKENIAG